MKIYILLTIVLLLIPGCASVPTTIDPSYELKTAQRRADFVLECVTLKTDSKDEYWLESCYEIADKVFRQRSKQSGR